MEVFTFYFITVFVDKHFTVSYMQLAQKVICKLHCELHIFLICIYLFCSILKKSGIMIMHSRQKCCVKVFISFNKLFSAI